MQYLSTMISTLSQTAPVETVKKQKKETISNIDLNMGRGELGQLVLAKTCEAKDCRTQIAEANDAV